MKKKVFKTFFAKIKGVDEDNKTVDAVVSTATKDRDGDIIEPEAFKKDLGRYKSNPVLLSSHRHDDLTKVIGKAESVSIDKAGLRVKFIYFTDDGNPEADWAFKLAQKGIAAFSVGFIPKKWEDMEKGKKGTKGYFVDRKYLEVELLEVSQVTVPSNPDATLRNNFDPEEEKVYELACKAFGWDKKGGDDGDDDKDDASDQKGGHESQEDNEKAIKTLTESIESLRKRIDLLEDINNTLTAEIQEIKAEQDNHEEKSYLDELFKENEEGDDDSFSIPDVKADELKEHLTKKE